MAGKFVSLEEAARLLGVSTDEVHRLVDRKKLFPMRDGATFKFKAEEVERLASSLGDEESVGDPLALDLDAGEPPAAGGDDDLVVGAADDDWVLGGGSGIESASQTILRGPAGAAGGGDKPASDSDDDLALESIIGASSPSLAAQATGVGLEIDDVAAAPASGATGSRATGSIVAGSGAGAALSGPLDSGLSLETADVVASGIDVAAGIDMAAASGIGGDLDLGGGQLGGEAFELGGDLGDDDSASVVIATEESGDSSFFGAAMDDSASVAFDDGSVSDISSTSLGVAPVEYAIDTTFSVWQILGLLACALLLLTGGFVMFDLVWTIRGPDERALSAPLLQALAKVLPW